MAGSSRLQTDAATITPAAKPVSARWTMAFSLPRMKNTHAAPNEVPKKGINMPRTTSIFMFKPPLVRSMTV
jgi:hypothetical protein